MLRIKPADRQHKKKEKAKFKTPFKSPSGPSGEFTETTIDISSSQSVLSQVSTSSQSTQLFPLHSRTPVDYKGYDSDHLEEVSNTTSPPINSKFATSDATATLPSSQKNLVQGLKRVTVKCGRQGSFSCTVRQPGSTSAAPLTPCLQRTSGKSSRGTRNNAPCCAPFLTGHSRENEENMPPKYVGSNSSKKTSSNTTECAAATSVNKQAVRTPGDIFNFSQTSQNKTADDRKRKESTANKRVKPSANKMKARLQLLALIEKTAIEIQILKRRYKKLQNQKMVAAYRIWADDSISMESQCATWEKVDDAGALPYVVPIPAVKRIRLMPQANVPSDERCASTEE